MKGFIKIVSFILVFLAFSIEVDAQVRKRVTKSSTTKKEKIVEDQVSFLDKTYGELKFGNIGFSNGLNLSSKITAGYKLHDRFSLGGGMKMFLQQFAVRNQPDPSIFDLGGFVHGRAKITNDIYFQAEYAFMTYSKDPDGYSIRGFFEDKKANYPLVGLGYMSGVGKWRFGVELLYIASEEARDFQGSIVEYWFGASYNF